MFEFQRNFPIIKAGPLTVNLRGEAPLNIRIIRQHLERCFNELRFSGYLLNFTQNTYFTSE